MNYSFYKPIQIVLNFIYISIFQIDLNEHKRLSEYKSLQELFTRKLNPSVVRFNKNKNEIISPVDGVLTYCDVVKKKTLFQIKGKEYALRQLLSDKVASLDRLKGGVYFNLYLSPKNYHHYHAPYDLKIRKAIFMPGKCYPVSRFFLKLKNNVFVENKRAILECEINKKILYMVFIGAFNVGKICFNFDKNIEELTEQKIINYNKPIVIMKGENLGHFKLGSTVVMIFEKGFLTSSKKAAEKIRFGEVLGVKNGKI